MKNPLYIRLNVGFREWLRILNFDHTSQRDMPVMLKAFLIFLEENDCNSITGITENHLENYLQVLSEQPCKAYVYEINDKTGKATVKPSSMTEKQFNKALKSIQ